VLDEHRLVARVGGPDPVAAMDVLLAAWAEAVHAAAAPEDRESRARSRSGGVGAALVAVAHAALDPAGVDLTLLRYAVLNPLSAPFWHRCGYRPLWTWWAVSPASRLRRGEAVGLGQPPT
jgi:hypothetical protein